MSSSVPVASLRAHLLNALLAVPGSRTFHLHVLVTTPRKPAQSLFLYADARPKCHVQDVLVLLSETQKTAEDDSSPANAVASGASPGPFPRIFVSAIEASVYAFPTSSSTILYISKVDGTGQGAYPSPTSTLIRAFLVFYASPRSPLYASSATSHHLWIHLFARSQRQYLFPNSADHPNKKPLGDVALCKWWKKMLGDVAKAVDDTNEIMVANDANTPALKTAPRTLRLYYVLPGQTELEASYLLGEAQDTHVSSRNQWIYSHPYNLHIELGIPVPSGLTSLPPQASQETQLAYLIPHFEDDPKSRFLDELAATSEEQAVAVPVPTPRKKRQKIGEGDGTMNSTLTFEEMDSGASNATSDIKNDQKEDRIDAEVTTDPAMPSGPTIKYIPPSSSPPRAGSLSPPPRPLTPDPTLSRNIMLSPQTPNLPTFPASLLSPHTPSPKSHIRTHTPQDLQTPSPQPLSRSPRTPRTPRRPKSDLDTISPAEFWERMSFRQECALGAVTGFFVAVFSQHAAAPQDNDPPAPSNGGTKSTAINILPPTLLSPGTIPHSVLKRIISSLLTGVEFSTAERAEKGTTVMESAIKGLCQGLNEGNSVKREPAMDNPKAAAVPENKDAENSTADVYAAHVYGSITTLNPSLVRGSEGTARSTSVGVAPTVNVLGVRRKKKRE